MSQYESVVGAQFVAECVQATMTTTTTTTTTTANNNSNKSCDNASPIAAATTTSCYKRVKDKDHDYKVDGQTKLSADSHQFPENEEANVLGHGTPEADRKQHGCTSAVEPQFTCKMLLNFEDAPDHLKFNPYIRRGYRTFLSTKLCLQSIFWWTNETINIWSHLFGCLLFIGLTIFDFQFLRVHAGVEDQILVVCLLVCFCLCMLLSSIYHIFSCKSVEHYDFFLSVDFLGISLSLVAIYISGMYYAFWCFQRLRIIYSVIALGMFGLAMALQIPRLNVSLNAKTLVLLLWAAYGIIPLGHWAVVMGGLENALVQLMVPRVIIMYGLCAVAFIFYAAKIPERWLTGKVDFFGHSHNWWHMFILAAFYHWHNTGIVYAEYRLNNGCSAGPTLT